MTHALSAAILPEHGLKVDVKLPIEATKWLNQWFHAVKSVVTRDQDYREMVRSGAAMGDFQRVLDPEHFAQPGEVGFFHNLAKG
ncbi:hypothetical protein INO62_13395, partial [Staphylococcus aureus]|nr:hypothetical protein [Staphylococcus aureus]